MCSSFDLEYSHGTEGDRQARLPDPLMQRIGGFNYNYHLTQSTPRALKSFDSLSLAQISSQINAEWSTVHIPPSPTQALVPCHFDPNHERHRTTGCSGIQCESCRRHSDPQQNSMHTRSRRQTGCTLRFRNISPLTKPKACDDWSYTHGSIDSDNYEFLSPRNSVHEHAKMVIPKHNDSVDEGVLRLEQLNRKVLLAMETQELDRRRSSVETSVSGQRRDSEQIKYIGGHERPTGSGLASEWIPPDSGKPPYRPLSRPEGQIRLFRLEKPAHGKISGSFIYSDIQSCPKYTALSYAWGEPIKTRKITVEGQDDFEIGENLWWFLHCRSLTMKKPRLFWIDAICIDQSNLDERNHQVGLMKQIYSMASNVYMWLGRESEDSRLGMEFLASEGAKPLKQQIDDYRTIWDKPEGKAIRNLCERPYFRRMWIIQEIIHAERLTVWCGSQRLDWPLPDMLYITLKTLEEENLLDRHESSRDILRSPALVMVWQRAHWRHPETPTPKLQTLIEIFQGWECTDVRDKVYALVSMADQKTAVVPNYLRSPRQIYHDVLRRGVACDDRFRELLARVLGLHADDPDSGLK